MTTKEALSHMNYVKEIIESEVPWTKSTDAIDVVSEAAKKQIPMKPHWMWVDKDGTVKEPFCRRCEKMYLIRRQNYCEECGQAIDWSKDE